MKLRTRLAHLVFAAATRPKGVQRCRQTLGLTPCGGDAHPRMGTHKRVLRSASPGFEWAYFEVIAIDAAAVAPARARWFDLDDARMRELPGQTAPGLAQVQSESGQPRRVASLSTAKGRVGIDPEGA